MKTPLTYLDFLLTGYLPGLPAWATCLYCGKKNRPDDTIRGKVKNVFCYGRKYGRTWRESSNFPPYGRKEGKLARCPAPHFEAWKLDSGAKVTGRIKMAEGSVRSQFRSATR